MTQFDSGDPVLGREQAPEHGPNFWGDLDASLTNTTSVMNPAVQTTEQPRVTGAGTNAGARTEQLPRVASMADHAGASRAEKPRRFWPIAAAAAVLAILGLGVLVLQRTTDPASEVVSGTAETTDSAAALDGPSDEAATDDDEAAEEASDPAPQDGSSDAEDGESVPVTGSAVDTGDESNDEAGVEPPPVREFESAFGATGSAAFFPFDDSLSANATFLANWRERALTWYADIDSSKKCVDSDVSTISYVNGSGLVQPIRDPQLGFSGTVSHFTLHEQNDLAAWLVSCGTQLELYAASLTNTGQVQELNLVWFGEGSPRAALMLWDGNEINLNAIAPDGTPFAIAYDTEVDSLTRNGDPARTALEASSPVERAATPLVATSDAGLSYWVGQAPSEIFSACPEVIASTDVEAETLWLRQGDANWLPALIDDTPLGRITAAAIEPVFSQVAFADVCQGQTQRLFLGTLRADGQISNLREVSLTPYVPGFASQLFWIDGQTLRIEIDNSEFGAAPNVLEFRFDDGRQAGIIVQIS